MNLRRHVDQNFKNKSALALVFKSKSLDMYEFAT